MKSMDMNAITQMTDKQLLEISKSKVTKICTIGLLQKSQISANVLRVREVNSVEDYWKKITQIKVKDYVRFYNSFCQEKTFVFVSHDRFVSVYNMSTEKWIYHENMHDEVQEIWSVVDTSYTGKRELGFVLHLRCVVGAGTISKLTFVLPAYSKDKAMGTQPQISVKHATMQEAEFVQKKTLGEAVISKAFNNTIGKLFKQTSDKIIISPKMNSSPEKRSERRTSASKSFKSTKSQREEDEEEVSSAFELRQVNNFSLTTIRDTCMSSLHPESVVSLLEYDHEEDKHEKDPTWFKNEKSKNDKKKENILSFLKDPVRAKAKNRFTDKEDRETLMNPSYPDHLQRFRFHSLQMECIRRNPYTFKPRNITLTPAIIQNNRLICLRFTKAI